MTVMKNWHCTAMALVFPPNGHSRQIKRGSVNTEQPFGIPGDPMAQNNETLNPTHARLV